MKEKFEPNLKCPQCGSKKILNRTPKIRESKGGPLVEQPPRLQCQACGHWESKEKPFIKIEPEPKQEVVAYSPSENKAAGFDPKNFEVGLTSPASPEERRLAEESATIHGGPDGKLVVYEKADEAFPDGICAQGKKVYEAEKEACAHIASKKAVEEMSFDERKAFLAETTSRVEAIIAKYGAEQLERETKKEAELSKILAAMERDAPVKGEIGPVKFPIYVIGDGKTVMAMLPISPEREAHEEQYIVGQAKVGWPCEGVRFFDVRTRGVEDLKHAIYSSISGKPVEGPLPSKRALELAAKAWTEPETAAMEMNTVLALAVARMIDEAIRETCGFKEAEFNARLQKIAYLNTKRARDFHVWENFYPRHLGTARPDFKLSEAILRGAYRRPETWMRFFDYVWDKQAVKIGYPGPKREGPIGSDVIGAAFEGATGRVLKTWEPPYTTEELLEEVKREVPELMASVTGWPETKCCDHFQKTMERSDQRLPRNSLYWLLIHLHGPAHLKSREEIAEMLAKRGM